MTKLNDATAWYGDRFNKWQGDYLGRRPTATELATIHALGARPGKQALANAMALRPAGVTGGQIVVACGAPQLNKMRGFINAGYLRRMPMSPVGGHTVYRTELTAKGAAKVKAAGVSEANALAKGDGEAKPAKASKPRKAKAPVTAPAPSTPISGAPSATVTPATVDQPAVQVDQPQA